MSTPQLEAWRRDGAWRIDPVHFRYLEALAGRLPAQPQAVRDLLQRKLQQALEEFSQRVAQAQPAPAARRSAPAACLPLKELNAHARAAAAARGAPPEGELASVRRFRADWDRQRTLQQVQEAEARKPAQAGPLNSHVLVLQGLALMRELSPAYLQQFVQQVEALQWLEMARAKPAPAKPRKR